MVKKSDKSAEKVDKVESESKNAHKEEKAEKPTVVESKNNHGVIIAVAIVLMILVGATMYFIGQNSVAAESCEVDGNGALLNESLGDDLESENTDDAKVEPEIVVDEEVEPVIIASVHELNDFELEFLERLELKRTEYRNDNLIVNLELSKGNRDFVEVWADAGYQDKAVSDVGTLSVRTEGLTEEEVINVQEITKIFETEEKDVIGVMLEDIKMDRLYTTDITHISIGIVEEDDKYYVDIISY